MKRPLILLLPLLALAAGCVSQVERLDDIADFKVTVDEETREVSITGFIASSSLGVARVVEKQCDDEFLIVVYSKPNVVTFRSGEINIKTRCPDDATSICFGDLAHRIWSSDRKLVPDAAATNAPAASEPRAEPDASAPHAEGAEVSGWAVVFEDCDEIVMSNRYVGMLRDEVIRRLGKPDKIEVHPASNLVHWVKFPAGIPSPTGDVVVLTFDNGSAQIGGETFVFLQSGSNSVEEVIGAVEIPPGVVL